MSTKKQEYCFDETLDLSTAFGVSAWQGELWQGELYGENSGDTPLSSPNPYKRRPLLPRRSPGMKVDSEGEASVGQRSAPTSPSRSRRSRSSSRSSSPHKNPWYPAGRRAPGGDHETESPYIIHPAFKHMFDEAGTGHSGSRNSTEFDQGRHRLIPVVSQPASITRRHSEGCNAELAVGKEREAVGVSAREHQPDICWRTEKRDYYKRPGKNDSSTTLSQLSPEKEASDSLDGAHTDSRRQAHQEDRRRQRTSKVYFKDVGYSRERVHGVDSRIRNPQTQSSADDRYIGSSSSSKTHAKGKVPATSVVLTGHDGQVLALKRHKGVLFSAAADGTAKVCPPYA